MASRPNPVSIQPWASETNYFQYLPSSPSKISHGRLPLIDLLKQHCIFLSLRIWESRGNFADPFTICQGSWRENAQNFSPMLGETRGKNNRSQAAFSLQIESLVALALLLWLRIDWGFTEWINESAFYNFWNGTYVMMSGRLPQLWVNVKRPICKVVSF